jgi:phosphoribosylglycinamide formyltransferase-1
MQASKKQLVILISGSGSNLQTFIDQCASGELNANIACVISNKATAFGLERAKKAGIHTEIVDHKEYASREAFDDALASTVNAYSPDLVILAGFMRILTPAFVEQFQGKIINIHPSLLPKYTGLNTHQRAIDAGESFAGATVHFVTAELDGGPAILQAQVPIAKNETAESLAAKVLIKEHQIFTEAAKWCLNKHVYLKADGAYIDQNKLPPQGYLFEH